jgi:DNA replication protein DnaC
LDSLAANLFFQVVSDRYVEVLCSPATRALGNGVSFWETETILATAVLDRLLHHSRVINIHRQSYRLREKGRRLWDPFEVYVRKRRGGSN